MLGSCRKKLSVSRYALFRFQSFFYIFKNKSPAPSVVSENAATAFFAARPQKRFIDFETSPNFSHQRADEQIITAFASWRGAAPLICLIYYLHAGLVTSLTFCFN